MTVVRWRRLSIPLLLAAALHACTDRDPIAPSYAVSRGAPAAPTNLAATAYSYEMITFAWQDNATNEDGFEVWRSTTGPTGTFTLFTTYPWPNTAQGGNSSLQPSTEYCYKVRALTLLGQSGKIRAYSDFSNTACATTLALPVPAAPSGVNAAPDAWGRIRIAWTDNATNESGFRVERSAASEGPWTSVGTTGPNAVSYDDRQPPAVEQPACYRVVALNNFGDSPASNVVCTSRPAAPTALAATVSGSDVDLVWTDNSNVEDGYQVQRWTEASGASVITIVAELPANATAYHDPGLPDNAYWYQVRAMKNGGTSGSSNNARAAVLTVPPVAPSAVNAYPLSSSAATVVWAFDPTNQSGFRVERSTDGGASWVFAGETPVTQYWSAGQFDDYGQPSEQQLCYRVIAFNSLGDSPPSNTDCTALPLGPTNVTAIGGDPQTIDLAWSDNSAVEDGYEVDAVFYYCGEYDEWGQCIWYSYYLLIATLGPNETSYRHTGLNSGEPWTYVVVALKDGGRSDTSNEVTVFVP